MDDDTDIYGDLGDFDAKIQLDQKTDEWKELNEKYDKVLEDMKKLQQENENLLKLNRNVKFNFNSLMATCKKEITRKDNTIDELRSNHDNKAFRRQTSKQMRDKITQTHQSCLSSSKTIATQTERSERDHKDRLGPKVQPERRPDSRDLDNERNKRRREDERRRDSFKKIDSYFFNTRDSSNKRKLYNSPDRDFRKYDKKSRLDETRNSERRERSKDKHLTSDTLSERRIEELKSSESEKNSVSPENRKKSQTPEMENIFHSQSNILKIDQNDLEMEQREEEELRQKTKSDLENSKNQNHSPETQSSKPETLKLTSFEGSLKLLNEEGLFVKINATKSPSSLLSELATSSKSYDFNDELNNRNSINENNIQEKVPDVVSNSSKSITKNLSIINQILNPRDDSQKELQISEEVESKIDNTLEDGELDDSVNPDSEINSKPEEKSENSPKITVVPNDRLLKKFTIPKVRTIYKKESPRKRHSPFYADKSHSNYHSRENQNRTRFERPFTKYIRPKLDLRVEKVDKYGKREHKSPLQDLEDQLMRPSNTRYNNNFHNNQRDSMDKYDNKDDRRKVENYENRDARKNMDRTSINVSETNDLNRKENFNTPINEEINKNTFEMKEIIKPTKNDNKVSNFNSTNLSPSTEIKEPVKTDVEKSNPKTLSITKHSTETERFERESHSSVNKPPPPNQPELAKEVSEAKTDEAVNNKTEIFKSRIDESNSINNPTKEIDQLNSRNSTIKTRRKSVFNTEFKNQLVEQEEHLTLSEPSKMTDEQQLTLRRNPVRSRRKSTYVPEPQQIEDETRKEVLKSEAEVSNYSTIKSSSEIKATNKDDSLKDVKEKPISRSNSIPKRRKSTYLGHEMRLEDKTVQKVSVKEAKGTDTNSVEAFNEKQESNNDRLEFVQEKLISRNNSIHKRRKSMYHGDKNTNDDGNPTGINSIRAFKRRSNEADDLKLLPQKPISKSISIPKGRESTYNGESVNSVDETVKEVTKDGVKGTNIKSIEPFNEIQEPNKNEGLKFVQENPISKNNSIPEGRKSIYNGESVNLGNETTKDEGNLTGINSIRAFKKESNEVDLKLLPQKPIPRRRKSMYSEIKAPEEETCQPLINMDKSQTPVSRTENKPLKSIRTRRKSTHCSKSRFTDEDDLPLVDFIVSKSVMDDSLDIKTNTIKKSTDSAKKEVRTRKVKSPIIPNNEESEKYPVKDTKGEEVGETSKNNGPNKEETKSKDEIEDLNKNKDPNNRVELPDSKNITIETRKQSIHHSETKKVEEEQTVVATTSKSVEQPETKTDLPEKNNEIENISDEIKEKEINEVKEKESNDQKEVEKRDSKNVSIKKRSKSICEPKSKVLDEDDLPLRTKSPAPLPETGRPLKNLENKLEEPLKVPEKEPVINKTVLQNGETDKIQNTAKSNGEVSLINNSPGSGCSTTNENLDKSNLPQAMSTPKAERHVTMGNSEYNISTDKEGITVMVIKRIKKKKK